MKSVGLLKTNTRNLGESSGKAGVAPTFGRRNQVEYDGLTKDRTIDHTTSIARSDFETVHGRNRFRMRTTPKDPLELDL